MRSAVAVPTDPSNTAVVPSDLNALNQLAVPLATAFAEVIAFAAAWPPVAPAGANAVAEKPKVTRSVPVAAALALAGWVPLRTWIVPPLHSAHTASVAAFAAASEINGLSA